MMLNMMFIFRMKTITMVELRTDSERIVRELARGVRMTLSYRGKPLAELVPVAGPMVISPLEALNRVQEVSGQEASHAKVVDAYLKKLRQDQKEWSDRS